MNVPRRQYGKYIRERRDALGMTQRDLAELIGVHNSAVDSWEGENTKPSLDNLHRLEEAMGPAALRLVKRVRCSCDLADKMDDILRMAEDGVIAAGSAAMQFFRPLPVDEHTYGRLGNPKLEADAHTHEVLVKSIGPDMQYLASEVGCEAVLYGEEFAADPDTPFGERIRATERKVPPGPQCHYADSVEDFVQKLTGDEESGPRLGVIADPIDGSSNLELGLGGQFVSAVAILDGSELLASAIYDPYGAVLYSAALHPGYDSHPATKIARMRHLRAGVTTKLEPDAEFGRRVLSFHASRTAKPERRAMLGQLSNLMAEALDVSASEPKDLRLFSGGITAINCGQASLAAVAARRYASFTTTITSIWDLAAGDLLIRCAGGYLTDFDGLPIDYGGGPEKISAVASWDRQLHAKMVERLRKVRNRR